MDITKCKALKAELSSEPAPQITTIEKFFDGNDDMGSIGCNLVDHPGVDTFSEILLGLLKRPDVAGVYARIYELDPGEGCWPFCETVFVVGKIPLEELRKIVAPLLPDVVTDDAKDYNAPETLLGHADRPVLAIWWD